MKSTTPLTKNQFRCYHCRLVFERRDGDWFDWKSMQVHLCRGCAKSTEERPERTGRGGFN